MMTTMFDLCCDKKKKSLNKDHNLFYYTYAFQPHPPCKYIMLEN